MLPFILLRKSARLASTTSADSAALGTRWGQKWHQDPGRWHELRFDSNHAKPEVFDKVSKQPISEGQTLCGAVKPLTDGNDPRVADQLAKWLSRSAGEAADAVLNGWRLRRLQDRNSSSADLVCAGARFTATAAAKPTTIRLRVRRIGMTLCGRLP